MKNIEDSIQLRKLSLTSESQTSLPLLDGKDRVALGSGLITKILGRGGMAVVYEIWNPQLEMYRAVKLINPGSIESVHRRFQTEIKICAKLRHPNIIEIHGVGEWNGLPYIEMEKIDGIGLDKVIQERGALPVTVCTAVGIIICRALNYAHNQDCTIYGKSYHGVIHRDLKPQNIMICSTGVVKLMDFGIARPVDVSFQTMDGLVSGTLQYLSPEQLEKKELDVRTDLYALGVTMYEIVTGVNAFPQTNFGHLVAHKTKNKFKPIEGFRINISKRLKHVIYKCMQHDPGKRIASAALLLHELEKIHAALTKKSPEEVIADLIGQASDKKVVIASRRHVPRPAIAVLCIFCLSAVLLFSYRIHVYSFIRQVHELSIQAQTNGKSRAFPDIPQFTNRSMQEISSIRSAPSAAPKINPLPKSTAAYPSNQVLPSASRERRTKSTIEALCEKYGTNDTFEILEEELRIKNYLNILYIYGNLSSEQAKTGRALICKLRALDGIGNKAMLDTFLNTTSLNEGEFCLAKAVHSYENQDFEECKKLLEKSLTLPRTLMDYGVLKREAYYYSALCTTAMFDSDPNEQEYKAALDAWWQLRTELRSNPDHPYNKKAISEMQRMAKTMQKSPTSGE